MNTIKAKFGKAFLQDLAHKMTIVQDEPDLQESYGITQEQVDSFCNSIPMNPKRGQEIAIPACMVECVRGEMENMADIFWSNAKSEGIAAISSASSIERQLEKIACNNPATCENVHVS